MFENTDDEESFFTLPPTKSSNLASLFGESNGASGVIGVGVGAVAAAAAAAAAAASNLTYVAPKQPKEEATAKQSGNRTKLPSLIVVFKEVNAFKLSDKNYQNQGRVGLALIGNEESKTYQLLLYRQKTDIISCSKVTSSFSLALQKEKHLSFTDDQKVMWTIRFNNEQDLEDFVRAVESKGGRTVRQHQQKQKQHHQQDESDDGSPCDKANILLRMARMGQKMMLPPSVEAETSSVEAETSDSDEASATPVATPPTRCGGLPVVQPSQFMLVNGQYVPVISQQSLVMPVTFETATATGCSLNEKFTAHFAENRTHNSEVRISVLRLANKIDELNDKLNARSSEESATAAQKVAELEDRCRAMTDEIECLKRAKEEAERRADRLQQQSHSEKTTAEERTTKDECDEDVEEILKRIMNTFYYELGSEFQDDGVFYGADVKKVLAPLIVEKTFKVAKQVKELMGGGNGSGSGSGGGGGGDKNNIKEQ